MKVIIDTDPGVDDVLAYLMAYTKPGIDVIAITTVSGNADTERVYQNALNVNNYLKVNNIPVYKGSNVNLSGVVGPQDGYFGKDAMGDISLEDTKLVENQPMSSAEALIYYARKFPGEIVYIAIGPLTNLAIAYLYDNKFPSLLKDLYIMGGDIAKITTRNCSDYAEFNAWSDPSAWNIVVKQFFLEGDKKIKIIDFDFCRKHVIPKDFAIKFFNDPPKPDSDLGLVWELINKFFKWTESKFDDEGLIISNQFLVYLALYEDKKMKGRNYDLLSVDLSLERGGHTIFKENSNGNIFIYDDFDMDGFLKAYYDSFHGF